MEFPISRSRLQNYKANEAVSAEIRMRVSKEIKKICATVERTVLTTNEHKLVYRIESDIKYPNAYSDNGPFGRAQPMPCIKELLEAIKHTFPDSSITIDPLETYIIIDWS